MDTVEAVVEVQAARGTIGEPGPGPEVVAAAQGGLQGREVSHDQPYDESRTTFCVESFCCNRYLGLVICPEYFLRRIAPLVF